MDQTFPAQPGAPEAVFGVCFVFGFVLLALALNIVLVVWPFCRIFSKAGYSWALGILMIVPVANIIMPFVLAFGDWPIFRKQGGYSQIPGSPSDPGSSPKEHFRTL
jgi:hypothetical protein